MDKELYLKNMTDFIDKLPELPYFQEEERKKIETISEDIKNAINQKNIDKVQALEDVLESYIVQIEPVIYEEFVNPSEKTTLDVLSKHGSVIELVKNPTDEMYLAASTAGGGKYIPDEKFTEEMGMNMVRFEPSDIQYAPLQTEEMKMYAVSKDGNLLQFIQEQTADVIKQAISQNKESVKYAEYQPEEVRNMLIEMDAYELIENPSLKDDMNAVKKDWNNLDKMYLQKDAVQRFAVQENPEALKYVILPEKETIKLGLEQNPEVEKYVRHKDTLKEAKEEMELDKIRKQEELDKAYEPKSFSEMEKMAKEKALSQAMQNRNIEKNERVQDEQERSRL